MMKCLAKNCFILSDIISNFPLNNSPEFIIIQQQHSEYYGEDEPTEIYSRLWLGTEQEYTTNN